MNATKQARREAKQLFRSCIFNGLLDEERARWAVQQIVATRSRGLLGILSHFRRLVKQDGARRMAKVQSATALPTDMQASVKAGLTRLYGAGLNVSFTDNPGLIGGMHIQVGSDVYDGSVRSRLGALEQRF